MISFEPVSWTITLGLIVQSVVVLPSRAVAIENLLRVYSPKLALVDTLLTRWLPKKWITALPAQVSSQYLALCLSPCFLGLES